MAEVLSECVLLIWAQPCQVPQCLRPIEMAKPSLIQVQRNGNDFLYPSVWVLAICTKPAKAASSSWMTAPRLTPPPCAVHDKRAEFSGCMAGALHQSEHDPPYPSFPCMCVCCFTVAYHFFIPNASQSGFQDEGMS